MKIYVSGLKPIYTMGIIAVYFLVCQLVSPLEYIFPTLLMCILIFLGCTFIYDSNYNILCIRNLFFLLLYVLGFYLRYILIIANDSRTLAFGATYAARSISPSNHTKTILCILLFTVAFIIGGSKTKNKNPLVKITSDNRPINSIMVIIYIVFTVVYTIYAFLNTRLATVQDFGIYDNLFNNIAYFNRFIAYIYLISYSRDKRKKHLCLYLLFILPYVGATLVSLYKGTALLEVLIFLAVMSRGRRIRPKAIILLLLVFLIIFPVISMLRINESLPGSYQMNLSGISKYYSTNNPIEYLSRRFQYYDETYFIINTDPAEMTQFREKINNPLVAFFTGIIPRVIWHNKPKGNFAYLVTHELLKIPSVFITNVTIGEVAESYIYGGIILIIFLGLFHGFLLRRNDEIIEDNDSPMAYACYLVIGNLLISFAEGLVIGKITILITLLIIVAVLKSMQNSGKYEAF